MNRRKFLKSASCFLGGLVAAPLSVRRASLPCGTWKNESKKVGLNNGMTLLEYSKRCNDGRTREIAEVLSQKNPLLADMSWEIC